MITISFHVKVRVDVAKENWESPEAISQGLADEIQSNLESLKSVLHDALDITNVQAEVTLIGRELS